MDRRLQILKEEEFRSNQHKQFQQLLAKRRVQVPKFLKKQVQDLAEIEKEEVKAPIVSDQLDKDSDENPGNVEEAPSKEEKSQVVSEVHLEAKLKDTAQ